MPDRLQFAGADADDTDVLFPKVTVSLQPRGVRWQIVRPQRSRHSRWLLAASLFATAVLAPELPGIGEPPRASASPSGAEEIVAVVVEGTGWGHGRGMSQWGAYGRAVAGQTWQQILDAYYGGTTLSDAASADHSPAANGRITVRLVGLDGLETTGVISAGGTAQVNGSGSWHALYAQHVSGNTYRVYGATQPRCPGSSALTVPDGPLARGDRGDAVAQIQQFLGTFGYEPGPIDGIFGAMTEAAVQRFQRAVGLTDNGRWTSAEAAAARQRIEADSGNGIWQDLGTMSAPVRFSTTVNTSTASGGAVLGVCQRNGSIIHYRGDIIARRDSAGARRTVNDVRLEDYLRGVVPREMSPSWGNAAGGAGMHALRAQAVAARSYALSQNRYASLGSYAKTCDTTACQAYGGAARRSGATASVEIREHALTDTAVSQTAGKIRRRSNGSVASTEYSASNGPRTAGGAYPAINDPFDDQPGNLNHRWTRVISASAISARYGTGALSVIRTETDPALVNQGFDGIWTNRVRVGGTTQQTVTAWTFRGHFGLPSPGFTIRPITRDLVTSQTFALIGDSISEGITGSSTAPLNALLNGVFGQTRFDAASGRTTSGGLSAITRIADGTNVAVVQLGYNDPSNYAGKIDLIMGALRAKGVGIVGWVNLSERRTDRGYAAVNQALRDARQRWPELRVLDWNSASSGGARDRWFSSDRVHLTATGRAEFARFLRDQTLALAGGGPVQPPTPPPSSPTRRVSPDNVLRVPVAGVAGAPAGASGVVLNVTGTDARGEGFVTVWPCGSARPWASSLNVAPGPAVANQVTARIDGTGEVCVFASTPTHVVVDVTGWFSSGFVPREAPQRLVDTREGGSRVSSNVLRVPVAGVAGAPAGASGVVLNVTGVGADEHGFVTVWPCGATRPWASSLNLAPGHTMANAVTARIDGTGEVCVFASTPTHVVVDVTGWFSSGFVPREAPQRLVDTREGGSRVSSNVLRVPVAGVAGAPAGASGVVLNVTGTDALGEGFVTVWPCGATRPWASSLNLAPGRAMANAVTARIDGTGEVCVFASTPTHVVVDVTGWFSSGFVPREAPQRLVDTRD